MEEGWVRSGPASLDPEATYFGTMRALDKNWYFYLAVEEWGQPRRS